MQTEYLCSNKITSLQKHEPPCQWFFSLSVSAPETNYYTKLLTTIWEIMHIGHRHWQEMLNDLPEMTLQLADDVGVFLNLTI